MKKQKISAAENRNSQVAWPITAARSDARGGPALQVNQVAMPYATIFIESIHHYQTFSLI